MKLVAQVKLVVTPEQAQALRETMAQANALCNRLSEWAWQTRTFGQYAIHKARYAQERAATSLAAQIVVRAIAKTADAYKLDKNAPRVFRANGSIAYDDRILAWHIHKKTVSIWTVAGRVKLPFLCGEHQSRLLEGQRGESDLAWIDGQFYLFAVCDTEEPPVIETDETIGVDLGIAQIATDSDGNAYSGEPVKAIRRKDKRIRALLQSKGTKNAKRHLKRLGRRVANYQRWVNHNIAKRLVEAARSSRKALALEDLTGIRERGNGFSREMKWQLGNWAFFQLRQFVAYKARSAGVPVRFVDARHTSQTCSCCGHCCRANRKSQSQFRCLSCGLEDNADRNAARNIRARADVTRPIDAFAFA